MITQSAVVQYSSVTFFFFGGGGGGLVGFCFVVVVEGSFIVVVMDSGGVVGTSLLVGIVERIGLLIPAPLFVVVAVVPDVASRALLDTYNSTNTTNRITKMAQRPAKNFNMDVLNWRVFNVWIISKDFMLSLVLSSPSYVFA